MRWLNTGVQILVLLSVSIVLAPRLAIQWPLLNLFALMQFPAALAGFAGSLIALGLSRSLAVRALDLVGLLVCGFSLPSPALAPSPCTNGAPEITIAWLNTFGAKHERRIIEWLQQTKPQVIGLAEFKTRPGKLSAFLAQEYPYQQSCLANGRCSTVLFARESPAQTFALAYGNPQKRKTLSGAAMQFPASSNQPARMYAAVHLSRPTSPEAQLRELTEFESRMGAAADTILIGDFNLSPRMPLLQDFASRNGLTIIRADRPTWPLVWNGRQMRSLWQIDNLLIGSNWHVQSMQTSEYLGSDHRGFVAHLCRS